MKQIVKILRRQYAGESTGDTESDSDSDPAPPEEEEKVAYPPAFDTNRDEQEAEIGDEGSVNKLSMKEEDIGSSPDRSHRQPRAGHMPKRMGIN